MVYSDATCIIASESDAEYAIIQSTFHNDWVRICGSSLRNDQRYTPSDCFETFPFPANLQGLEDISIRYDQHRQSIMLSRQEGLTKTYNRFHDPEESSADILKLRELHAKMDTAVLTAYGWTDLPTTCDFILDYEDEETAEESTGRKKKKPWRFRWPSA